MLDGELVIPGGSFESLQLRLHPAESRIRKLARETPAQLIVFDLLARSGASLLDRPLAERRRELEDFMAQSADAGAAARRGDRDEAVARGGSDGRVSTASSPSGSIFPTSPASGRCGSSSSGRRSIASWAGYTESATSQAVEHLLLGLYDEEGRLNYVGRARIYEDAAEIGRLLEPLVGGRGFTGRAPGGKSRWSGKERVPVPLEPVLVVEVSADHITGEHMRHGARLLRWRTDKPPESCTMDQIR